MPSSSISSIAIVTTGLVALLFAYYTYVYQHTSSSTTPKTTTSTQQATTSQTMTSNNDRYFDVVVVGGGLAGMSAAIEAQRSGASVVLIDKEKRLGGNSAKASSGINAVGSEAQHVRHIDDTPDAFKGDTLASGQGLSIPGLVDVLVDDSASAIEFLASFGIDLSVLSQIGGHSFPRTHRGKPAPDGTVRNIGWEITSTLEKHITTEGKITVLTSTKLTSLLSEEQHQDSSKHSKRVTGVRCTNLTDGSVFEIKSKAVILASGGFGYDRKGLLHKYTPHYENLPTTNGPWAMGEALPIVEEIGATLVLMDKVQVHPTSFIDPKDPKNPSKFLAPEALRGSGAILLNSKGQRFVNELGWRDTVTKAIFEHCEKYNSDTDAPVVAFALLNDQAVELFHRSVFSFYQKRGFARVFDNVQQLTTALGMDYETVKSTIERYNECASKNVKDEFGKVTFPVQFNLEEKIYVTEITPAIHYTMGGALINQRAQILHVDETSKQELPIPGLYGAGEVTGGVHGANRLGGNSLLECAVYGRIAGKTAVKEEKIIH